MANKEIRKANSFTEGEVTLACKILNDMLSGSRVSTALIRRPAFTTLFRKFVKMKAAIEESKNVADNDLRRGA